MNKKILVIISVCFIVVFLMAFDVTSGNAMPSLQTTPFPTPTPGPDGRILYIVQAGDTLWDISFISGIEIDQLRSLNNMEDGDVVIPGQILILSVQGQQGEGVEGVDLTPTVEPTLEAGTGAICILLYEDISGDSFRQELEPVIPDGAVSVSEKFGLFSASAATLAGYDPVCFDGIPEGEYNISVALPENYNPTTYMNASLSLIAGDTAFINFGGQFTGKEIVPEVETGGTSDLLLGIGGIIFVVGGLGLGAYVFLRGSKSDLA